MSKFIDRYNNFRVDSLISPIPGINIPESETDKKMIYKSGVTRLDKLSQMYYNNPYSGWLIMLANQEYGGLEFNIPDSSIIRIPFPFDSAISRYNTQINYHKKLYGE